MGTSTQSATIHQLWPLLGVTDIDRSIVFYRDKLGFSLVRSAESKGKIFWCRLERGGASVMLQQLTAEDGSTENRGRGINFYFVCDDVDPLYTEFTSRGLNIKPPVTTYYGMKQMYIPEPDGYSVCFESEVKQA